MASSLPQANEAPGLLQSARRASHLRQLQGLLSASEE